MERKTGLLNQIKEGIHDLCYIWAEEMKHIWKDEGVLTFFILVPLLYPLAYSWIYTNEVVREVPVAVVDMSHSHLSRKFIRQFDASPDTKIAYHCKDMNEAKDLIGQQKAYGVLYFPSDFQTNVLRLEQSHVGVYCDMSFMLYYKSIFQTATSVASELGSEIQIERSGNWTERENEISTKPLDFDAVQIFNTTGGYGNFIIPGVLMLIIQQTLLLGIGLSAGRSQETKGYRNLVPISEHNNGMFRIVLGKSLCYFMIYAVIAAYLTLIVPRIFDFVSILYPGDLFWFMLPYLLACIFFAMIVSFAVRYRENIMLMVVFTSVPFLFLSGVSWPQSGIPEFWQWISSLIPSTFGVRGFVRMNTMGARLGDVLPEYQALWIQTLVYFFITCLLYRKKIKGIDR
ncbi:MAG: ABC transporter permease [Prevotellaceae bacterium]|nr:ABC transporter permease [Prevotellaceae bacterium]